MCFNIKDRLFLESFLFMSVSRNIVEGPRIRVRMQSVLVLVANEYSGCNHYCCFHCFVLFN